MDNGYKELAGAIILHQESIMGPLAWVEAGKVGGINITNREVNISGNGKEILEKLVLQFENMFGMASIEACKDAVRPYLPKYSNIDIPQVLL